MAENDNHKLHRSPQGVDILELGKGVVFKREFFELDTETPALKDEDVTPSFGITEDCER
eukprot:CAMPEP_0197540006 /NCGR_PEP_ID=MMETSP1318-20131121/64443_1 /TAXON_ID=552666 /ORGANISM="Partenskyella glossopodia, Strain RCC365" /LENGTH=58 /DNA_ID=CAMNT_0043098875 /DNA_START=99 /DNA_END=271 /DNA_ORIENTATION=+